MNAVEKLLLDVQAKSFLAHELLLYLDTHPEDCEAFHAYQCALNERREAVHLYEREVRALTPDGLRCDSDFNWIDEPYPWQ
ncbi:MAG: spore coat protein CotJB [Clostridia bacterium]|nr:spore coat protein CotJB [Clostridia bacterium]